MKNRHACLVLPFFVFTARAYCQAPGPCSPDHLYVPGCIPTLSRQISEQAKIINTLKGRLKDDEGSLAAAARASDSADAMREQQSRKLDKLISDQARDISLLKTKLNDDERALTAAAAANQSVDAKLDQQSKLIADLEDQLAVQKTALSSQANTYANNLSALRAELTAKVSDAEAKAEAKAEAVRQELIRSLSEDVKVINGHTQQIGDFGKQLSTHENSIKAHESRLTTFDARLKTDEASLNASTLRHLSYMSEDSSHLESGYLGTSNKGIGMLQLWAPDASKPDGSFNKLLLEETSNDLGGYLAVFSKHKNLAAKDEYVAAMLRVQDDGKGKLDLYGKAGLDVAEQFESAGAALRAGTVAAVVPGGKLSPSSRPYDRTVVGVVSGAGSLSPAISIGAESHSHAGTPIAVAGQVYVRVCLQAGAIRRGDLLVASSREGVAMRASESEPIEGAVIGKALESFDFGSQGPGGEGLVRMMVMLR